MDNKDEMKRIEGVPEMKEIPAQFEAADPTRKVAAADAVANSHLSDVRWGIIASVAVLAMVVGVYLLSGLRTDSINETGSSANGSSLMAYAFENAVITNESDAGDNTTPATASISEEMIAEAIEQTPDAVYLFPLNGTAIADNADLNEVANEAAANEANIVVIAYTDESGASDFNRKLSEQRAVAVAQYLEAHGVAHDHIAVRGMGETHRFDTNALDRRAEVHII